MTNDLSRASDWGRFGVRVKVVTEGWPHLPSELSDLADDTEAGLVGNPLLDVRAEVGEQASRAPAAHATRSAPS